MVVRHAAVAKKLIEIVEKQLPRIDRSKLTPGQAAKLAAIASLIEMRALGKPEDDDAVATVSIFLHLPECPHCHKPLQMPIF